MNASGDGGFAGSAGAAGSVQSGTAVLVELSADIHICGVCRQQFNNLDAFVAHKQTGCQLSGAGAAPGTVQFVAEETVPITQAQTTTTTITSETQTITVSAPEFVFEHGYQTYLPTESSENQTTTIISLPAKARTKKAAAPPAQKRLNCCYPGCQFKTAYGMKDMERHLKIHTGDKPHKCDTCGKCFSRKDKLKTHTRCHTGQKPYKCKTCDYAAADSSSLNKHLRIHSDERPFKCQLCPYASRNSSQLTVHLRSHTGDAPFQCWLCSAKFKISSDLKRHMRVHSGEKPFKCEFCHVRCTMKGNLKSHIRIKHSGDSFKCPHCAFVGDSRAALRKHSRAHQAERPEKCSQCSYSSASKAALRVHERVHCAERPFKCSFCSFDTKQPSNLSKHLKKTHGHLAPPAAAAPAAPRREPGRQGGRQLARLDAKKTFHCDACDAAFMRADSLRSHRRQHGHAHAGHAHAGHAHKAAAAAADLAVLQLQIHPGKAPLPPGPAPAFGDGGRVKIIVGPQVPPADPAAAAVVQGAAPAATATATALGLVAPGGAEELAAGGRLQILRQVSLIAPAPAAQVGSPPVLLAAPAQALIPAAAAAAPPAGPPEGAGGPTFIASPGISCADFEGLNALIQEGAAEVAEVTVVSDGGPSMAVAPAAPPIFSSAQPDLPKPSFSIIQAAAHPALLCPADSIPD
ncbi:zinc finger protein 64-like [Perognathus longimembris pacificus]|uniref:zinc finger protein 64-like n=1 Tax=Perognathus longimembris pacificus TaxID=214514 RepID=UPI0020190053|nr:zinc finger protein 64-like [Perognathus longimembris pacificus]